MAVMDIFEVTRNDFYGDFVLSKHLEDQYDLDRRMEFIGSLLDKLTKRKFVIRHDTETRMRSWIDCAINALKNGNKTRYRDYMAAFEEEAKNYVDFPNDDEFEKPNFEDYISTSDATDYVDSLRREHEKRRHEIERHEHEKRRHVEEFLIVQCIV